MVELSSTSKMRRADIETVSPLPACRRVVRDGDVSLGAEISSTR
jgi:hypothetical protein